jgi:hypothetical protein
MIAVNNHRVPGLGLQFLERAIEARKKSIHSWKEMDEPKVFL